MFVWWSYEYDGIWNRNNGKSNLRLLYFQLHSKVFLSKYLVLFRNGKASVCRLVLEWFPIPPDLALEQDLSYSQIPVFPNTQHNVVCLFQKYHWMFSELHEIRMIHFRHFVYIGGKFFMIIIIWIGISIEKFMRLLTCNIQHILLGTTLHTLYLPCHLLFLFAPELDNVCLKALEAPCCNQLYWSSRKIVNSNAFIVIHILYILFDK